MQSKITRQSCPAPSGRARPAPMAGLAVGLALLLPTDALAQSSTYYDRTGRVSGRSTTGTNGATHLLRQRWQGDWSRVNQRQHHDDL